LDNVRELIRTPAGPVFTGPIRSALGDLPAVDIAVAYGVADRRRSQVAVAAVTLRPDHELEASELSATLAGLPRPQRPTVVRVVAEIPVTTWYRPITATLSDAGVPAPTPGLPAFHRGPRADAYKPLTAANRKRFTG
nr:acyl-CoA synthetase [Actinomycetota bacterium]